MKEAALFFGVLGAFVAFVDEHKRCVDLDGGVDPRLRLASVFLWGADRPPS
jgi:hypothetical protein